MLFNTVMVQAILEGNKTSTRRIIKPHRKATIENIWFDKEDGDVVTVYNDNKHIGEKGYIKPPYYVGDIIYVRETWLKGDDGYHFRANETFVSKVVREAYGYKWKPSIHMPKVAARLFLKVTDIRAERLQDITEDGAEKEGCENDVIDSDIMTVKQSFEHLWDNLYKNWNENPWVWVIEFTKVGD